MATVPARLQQVVDAFRNTGSLTVLVVAGRTTAEVAELLEVDLADRVDEGDLPLDEDRTAWALLPISGGVIAREDSGFGDPSVTTLVKLSARGRAAAVARSNIQHDRFGCARDGELLFDADEYWLGADRTEVPDELLPLFDTVWVGDSDDDLPDDHPDPLLVGLAMAELTTGLVLEAGQVAELAGADLYSAPSVVYHRPE